MYAVVDFPTKKSLKDAVAEGRQIGVFQPGGLFPGTTDGRAVIQGPHHPKPHKWAATVWLEGAVIVKVLS